VLKDKSIDNVARGAASAAGVVMEESSEGRVSNCASNVDDHSGHDYAKQGLTRHKKVSGVIFPSNIRMEVSNS
jgi:hypothetical protein